MVASLVQDHSANECGSQDLSLSPAALGLENAPSMLPLFNGCAHGWKPHCILRVDSLFPIRFVKCSDMV